MRSAAVTIKELSFLSGYSISTVSKALNNKLEISKATRDTIKTIAKQHNYVPNNYAVSLRMQKTGSIAVILPEVTKARYSHSLCHLQKSAENLGYRILFYQSFNSKTKDSYLALVYLTRAGTSDMAYFQRAFDEAKEVIDNAGTYGLALDPDFQTLFNANIIDGSMEPIFALDYNNVEAPDNAYDQISPMCGIRGDDGWSVAVPTMAVYDSFIPGDYRRNVSFQTEATINGTTVDFTEFNISGHEHAANRPYMAKYSRYPGEFARGSKRATSHNYSMMRYAEVLLIAAEAGVEIGSPLALNYINEVRGRARNGGQSTSGGYTEMTFPASAIPADLGSVTVADVLEERRMEFAFECKRWYDIKRRQLGDQVFGASGYEGAKPDWNGALDYDTPIPQDEIDRNPNLTN